MSIATAFLQGDFPVAFLLSFAFAAVAAAFILFGLFTLRH